jgi:hypothetical protein
VGIKIPVIEDYPYAGINVSRDPDMPAHLRDERGEMGMFLLLKLFNF